MTNESQGTPGQAAADPLPDVIVVGSVNVDLTLTVERQAADGETVIAREMRRGLGGKGANQAAAAARVGARVSMVGAVGADRDGDFARESLARTGVGVSQLAAIDDVPTGVAIVTLSDDGENRIVVHAGANARVTAPDALAALALAPRAIVVTQGEVPAATVGALLEHAAPTDRRVVVNLAPMVEVGAVLSAADPLVVNEIELGQLTGAAVGSMADAQAQIALLSRSIRSVVVTLGAHGALVAIDGVVEAVPAPPVDRVVDTTGAGDAFVGVLAARLAAGDQLIDAARSAVICASAAVQVLGAADAYPDFSRILLEAGRDIGGDDGNRTRAISLGS